MRNSTRLLFVGTREDESYLLMLKDCLGGVSTAVTLDTPTTFAELELLMKEKKATDVVTTSPALLEKLTGKKASISNYAGSLFQKGKYEILVIDPLKQLVTVPYGKFMARRYITKLTARETWYPTPQFKWSLFCESTIHVLYQKWSHAIAIAVDIETYKTNLAIRCIGFTAILPDATLESLVVPLEDLSALAWCRQLVSLPAPKIFQNGKYDLSYLARYNIVPHFYLWDTAEMFHSWYAELPKDLASLSAFFVRESMYWKDLADTSDLKTYYLYNAKDTWATAVVFLAWMAQSPDWAKANYGNTFPLQFPCHMSEMTGIKRDITALKAECEAQQEKIKSLSASLDSMLGVTNFNVASPIQMKALLKILGCGDLESADEKSLQKAAFRHPLNERIVGVILQIRKARKLVSTYLTEGKELNGRILYALNPHGTDTGRLASKEHHFWCGLQIQNIPRGDSVKRTLVADEGFRIAEADLEQAESRDTAHIAGCESLIAAVSGDKDFHSLNASSFFGVPYEKIFSDELGKTLDKPLRDLAKRVNHGANYNMGEDVLVETMGEKKVREAQKILGLPKIWTCKQVAAFLLARFHETYPELREVYYKGVINEIAITTRLTSKATHDCAYQAFPDSPLVRYCFSDPRKSKSALNAYVAHPPQSLNAMTLNRAYMRVFYEVALKNRNFRLLAQIHDSILFQFKQGHEYLAEEVKKRMEIPVTVRGYDGVTRTFTVPAAVKAGKDGKGAVNWSLTE